MALSVSSKSFLPFERIALMRAGFITSSSQSQSTENIFSRPGATDSGAITSIASISRAASGSVAAVGGEGAVHGAGGRGGFRRTSAQFERQSEGERQTLDVVEDLQLSLPGMVSIFLDLFAMFSGGLRHTLELGRYFGITAALLTCLTTLK